MTSAVETRVVLTILRLLGPTPSNCNVRIEGTWIPRFEGRVRTGRRSPERLCAITAHEGEDVGRVESHVGRGT